MNIGHSLSVKRGVDTLSPGDSIDTDAAMAAADLVKKLEKGYYMDRGKRRKIDCDCSKLLFAENLSSLQRRLLADFRFRCCSLLGARFCSDDLKLTQRL